MPENILYHGPTSILRPTSELVETAASKSSQVILTIYSWSFVSITNNEIVVMGDKTCFCHYLKHRARD